MRTLYLCYFGLREPLVQTQVLPYLRQLRNGGTEVFLLTFEPNARELWNPKAVEEWRTRLEEDGIRWSWLPYHKRPSLPATLYDIMAGAWTAARMARREGIDVLHGRAHVAAAMGALAKRLSGGRLVFDIRGLIPEEYVDAGVWPEGGLNYRLTKRAEQSLLRAADGFVVLSERGRDILFPGRQDRDARGRPIEVIPCCVDMERFRAAAALSREALRGELGLAGRRVLVYVGALGGFYMTDEMVQFLAGAHRQDPSTYSMVLTQSPSEKLAAQMKASGIREEDCLIRKVPPAEIPRYLRAADLGISFIKPCFSKLASSPTKFAEYLASGLPVVCNAGIGDVDRIVEDDRVGVLIRELNEQAYLEALQAADLLRGESGVAERCRAAARDRFDLTRVGGARYRRLYQRLFEGEPGRLPVAEALR
jgi:glycosyltransferase involved in cell wall biosynthesis